MGKLQIVGAGGDDGQQHCDDRGRPHLLHTG